MVNQDPKPSLLDSSIKTSSSDLISREKKRDKKKKRHKHQNDDSYDSSSSDDSQSSDVSDYIRKLRKKKNHQKKDLIEIFAHLTANMMTTAYKSKIIGFRFRAAVYLDRVQKKEYQLAEFI